MELALLFLEEASLSLMLLLQLLFVGIHLLIHFLDFLMVILLLGLEPLFILAHQVFILLLQVFNLLRMELHSLFLDSDLSGILKFLLDEFIRELLVLLPEAFNLFIQL